MRNYLAVYDLRVVIPNDVIYQNVSHKFEAADDASALRLARDNLEAAVQGNIAPLEGEVASGRLSTLYEVRAIPIGDQEGM